MPSPTPMHTIRIDEDLWAAFGLVAGDRTSVLRDFIRWYVREPKAKMPKRPALASDQSTNGSTLRR